MAVGLLLFVLFTGSTVFLLRAVVRCTAAVGAEATGLARTVRELGEVALPGGGSVRLAALDPAELVGATPALAATGSAPPREVTPLVGRSDEQRRILEMLVPGVVVTLTGPGGVGKTRVAQRVAARAMAGGTVVHWCGLGSLGASGTPADEVLRAVGGHARGGTDAVSGIVDRLADGASRLLVLDNCEHHLDGVARLVEDVTARVPGLVVLATSREPLGVAVEQAVPLATLSPEAAVALFVAAAARHGVLLDHDDVRVRRLCARLDDLPLAIELAAARVATVDLDTLDGLLEERFAVLRSPATAGPSHHRTLAATIAWSIETLSTEALGALSSLAVFADHFAFDDADAVIDSSSRSDTLGRLDELRRKSLLDRRADGGFRLLESVRAYVREHTDDPRPARDRHLALVVERAVANDRSLTGQVERGLARFGEDLDDIRAALEHAAATGRHDHVHALLAACVGWAGLAQVHEVLGWPARYLDLDAPVSSVAHAEALALGAYALADVGRHEAACRLAVRVADEVPGSVAARHVATWTSLTSGDVGGAVRRMHALVDDAGGVPHVLVTGTLLQLVGIAAAAGGQGGPVRGIDLDLLAARLEAGAADGDGFQRAAAGIARGAATALTSPAAAMALYDEAGSIAAAAGMEVVVALAGTLRAVAAVQVGDTRVAAGAVHEALVRVHDAGMRGWALGDLPLAAAACLAADDVAGATVLLGAWHAAGLANSPASLGAGRIVDDARDRAGDQFAGWWSTGAVTSPDAALALAIERTRDLALEPEG